MYTKAWNIYMQTKHQKELNDLSTALFILKELALRLDISTMYNGIYHKERVQEMLVIWKKQQAIIESIKLRWWDFSEKRYIIKEIKLFRQAIRIHLSSEMANQYNV